MQKMEEQRPRRGQRRRDQTKEIGINITNFKEFLSSKLEFKVPEGYTALPMEKKKETWKNLFNVLKSQKQKISYQFPDHWKIDEVNLIMDVIRSENQDCSLDYEYEEMFLGNKKQLLIYKKCRQMDEYLEKYRLPKTYQSSLKDVQSVAKQMFEIKMQINIVISLVDKEKINELNQELKIIEDKFNSSFQKFKEQMRKVFEHFKGQIKRTIINLEILRQSIFEKLKPLANELQLNIFSRYPDVQNQEFLYIQVTKKNEFDRFDAQNGDNDIKEQENQISNDESSLVSDISEQEKQLQLEDLKRKALPPTGIYSIQFEKYENQLLTLKVSFEMTRNKLQMPKFLEYGKSRESFESSVQIPNVMSDLTISFPIKNQKFISVSLRTRNDYGTSQTKNFRYHLNLDLQNNLMKNGNLYFIGEDKYLVPLERTRKQGDIYSLTLAVSEFSMSSTQIQICDADGNSADWGLFKNDSEKKQEVIQSNSVFQIVNNSNNMYYQEPAIRLDKSYQIIKSSCGAGYGMLLDAFGTVWVFGKNTCGQLGTKDETSDDEPVKLKFFEENKIFITQIKASESLASFAIDSSGMLYKWGLNQFHSTNEPIYDRFGKVINYSLSNYFQQQWNPLSVKKHFQNEKIVQVQSGNQFYLILNNQGTLYGWGQCRNLGKGIMKDGKDQEIQNICNDIELMKNVQKVSAGRDHAIILSKQGKVFGWGNLLYLSNLKKEFSQTPVDLTEEYGELSPQDKLVCGSSYTCLHKSKEGKIKLFGDTNNFKNKEVNMSQQVRKIQCGQSVIAILTDKMEIDNK